MASFNKIIVVGYLGRDPEIRYTSDGTPVCSFTVATTERKKDKSGEFQDATTWFRVSVWRRQAELANQYLSKGKQVYIEGRLSSNEYQDRDGNTRTSLEIQATDIQFLGSRGEGDQIPKEEAPSRPQSSGSSNISDDDIPF
jgi:single-strand DNA-binding protein